MSIIDLIEKSKKETLSAEELSSIIQALNVEMGELKINDPQQYLKITKELTSIVRDLNKELGSIQVLKKEDAEALKAKLEEAGTEVTLK